MMEENKQENKLENKEEANKVEENKAREPKNKKGLRLLILTNILTFLLTALLISRIDSKIIYGSRGPGDRKINKVEKFVKRNYLRDVDDQALVDGKLKGVLSSLKDPYSSYMTQDEFNELLDETHGSFGGVGIVVGVDMDKDLLQIIAPMKDGPGDRAGLKAGDYIMEVNGKVFTGHDSNEAVKEMKGEIGTDLSIKVGRNLGKDNEETKVYSITRDEIKMETVSSQMMEDRLGYLRISSFDENTQEDFEEQLDQLEAQGMEGLVLDLRNNPGGLLDVTAKIADRFLGKGDIVYTEDKNGQREYLKSDSKKVDYPVTILVNEGSASASEVLSGALKDRDRAKLVGGKTFGKGVVQRLVDLGDGTGLKLTVAEYFTPTGRKIDGLGLNPDYLVELPEDIEVIGLENIDQDLQLQKAVEVVKSEIKNK